MKKRILSMLIAVIMLVSIMPFQAFAADESFLKIGGKTLDFTQSSVDVFGDGTVVAVRNVVTSGNDTFVTYKLTLKNAAITGDILTGENDSLDILPAGGTENTINGKIYCGNVLTFEGDGSLSVTSEDGIAVQGYGVFVKIPLVATGKLGGVAFTSNLYMRGGSLTAYCSDASSGQAILLMSGAKSPLMLLLSDPVITVGASPETAAVTSGLHASDLYSTSRGYKYVKVAPHDLITSVDLTGAIQPYSFERPVNRVILPADAPYTAIVRWKDPSGTSLWEDKSVFQYSYNYTYTVTLQLPSSSTSNFPTDSSKITATVNGEAAYVTCKDPYMIEVTKVFTAK